MAWGDNHTKFETTHKLDTKYASGPAITGDNLFIDQTGGDDGVTEPTGTATVEYNAKFVFKDATEEPAIND